MKLPIVYDRTHWAIRKKAREQYVVEQNGKCQCCRELLSDKPSRAIRDMPINKALFPVNMFKHPVHLHHDRKTGWTIGAVHAQCNAYLWQYKNE